MGTPLGVLLPPPPSICLLRIFCWRCQSQIQKCVDHTERAAPPSRPALLPSIPELQSTGSGLSARHLSSGINFALNDELQTLALWLREKFCVPRQPRDKAVNLRIRLTFCSCSSTIVGTEDSHAPPPPSQTLSDSACI